ncbi:Cd(II)/Pb(II)-responsive transcriptional regulator [Geobacter sp. FeAm09]|uniref:Cd(II)/Pb(II)-responsive transcriptional regulator n=1 Tax=Geobacter sp. FeAm09 TaxID=2597769 RepID=UPI0011EC8DDC|nr:Cd(II)/Pb(II)-responsive transcriptional regulator [Geobacter sp. FeAm09]QEM68287.1 Cd(II)/Pb(II)-responsive transcriptional regulator [Geobacter sp. FeAm09]
MKIGELAQRSACKVETVRFYEREGLLEQPAREGNGYRNYTDAHVTQLNFIRHCRSLGMGLPDVRILRSFQAHPELACDEINRLIDSQIDRVHAQIEALRVLEQQLHSLRDTCQANTNVADCAILRNLEQAAAGENCPCHPLGENVKSS